MSQSQTWYNQALELLRKQRYPEALTAIDRSIAADPHFSAAWNIKSILLFFLGQVKEGVAAIDCALEITPNDSSYWNNKALALQSLSKREEAKAYQVWATQLKETPVANLLPSNAYAIVHVIGILLAAQTWDETHQILTQHQRLICTDISTKTLELLVKQTEQSDEDDKSAFLSWLTIHQTLLSDVCIYGLERAWKAFEAFLRLMETIPPSSLLAPPGKA